jgi:hypothetical protein
VHGLNVSNEVRASYRLLAVNILLHDTILEDAHGLQDVQSSGVAWVNPVENKSDDNFLPGRRITVPKTRIGQIADVPNVLHDSVKGTRRQHLVFLLGRLVNMEE